VQQQAGIEIGTDYPTPIIDHSAARQRVLTLYKGLRAAN
jgi:deoxyribodipyrimidine photolyase